MNKIIGIIDFSLDYNQEIESIDIIKEHEVTDEGLVTILIKELTLDLKLGYYDFEKEKSQKVKFSLEIDYEDKKPTNDKDIKSIVNYGQVVKLITKLAKNKHYNFLETLAEDVFDVLFKDKRIGKIMLQIEKLEIIKECASVGIQITKKRSHEKL